MKKEEQTLKKLVVSDLDGTVFDSETTGSVVIEELKKKVKEFVEEGNIFTIATGRPLSTTKSVMESLGLDFPYIINNGAQIVDMKGNIIYTNSFTFGDFMKPLEEFRKLGVTVIFEYEEKMYCLEKTPYVLHFEHKENVPCEVFKNLELLKEVDVLKILIIGDVPQCTEVWNKLDTKLTEKYRYIVSEDNYFEIAKASVSKGEALNRLTKYLKINPKNVYTVGNHLNDKELIEVGAVGYAVANAREELKDLADRVTKENFGLGVIEVMEAARNLS